MTTPKPRMDRDSLLPKLKDLSHWATVDLTLLDEEDADRVARRIQAVRAYIEGQPVGILSFEQPRQMAPGLLSREEQPVHSRCCSTDTQRSERR